MLSVDIDQDVVLNLSLLAPDFALLQSGIPSLYKLATNIIDWKVLIQWSANINDGPWGENLPNWFTPHHRVIGIFFYWITDALHSLSSSGHELMGWDSKPYGRFYICKNI